MVQTYPIALEEKLPSGRTRTNTRAIGTGKIRPPMRGEWYLSGAIVEAYRAPSNLRTSFEIAELVEDGTSTVTEYRIEARNKGTVYWRFIRFTGAGPYTDEARAWREAENQTERSGHLYDFRVTHRTKTITTTPWEE